MEIILFCLGVIGSAHIIVDGSIFQWLRDLPDSLKKVIDWSEEKITKFLFTIPKWIKALCFTFPKWILDKVSALLHCYQCTGFWCGFIIGMLIFPNLSTLQNFIASGGAGAFLSSWAATYLNCLDNQGTYFASKAIITLSDEKERE